MSESGKPRTLGCGAVTGVTYQDPLRIALAPIWDMLSDPETEDVAFNVPGVAWWYKEGRWSPVDVPEMTYRRLHGVAVLAASQTRKTISQRHPILEADIPNGSRLHAVIPPAVPDGTASLTFRRHSDYVSPVEDVGKRFDTSRWNGWRSRAARLKADSAELLGLYDNGDIERFLRGIVRTRRTPLFGGPTGSGKTWILKTYLSMLPLTARVLVLEDAREATILQPNHVRLIFSTGAMSQTAMLKALLRMRPCYAVLGELRSPEAAWTFMNEAVAGHPGSPTSLHGTDPPQIARRLFNLVKGSDEGRMMGDETVVDLLSSVVDLIVPISNTGSVRAINEVWFADDAARRGETFRDLLRAA